MPATRAIAVGREAGGPSAIGPPPGTCPPAIAVGRDAGGPSATIQPPGSGLLAIAVLPGEAPGPDVTAAAVRVLERSAARHGLPVDFHWFAPAGGLPDPLLPTFAARYAALLLGPWAAGSPTARRFRRRLSQGLDLFLNLRPVRLLNPEHSLLRGRRLPPMELMVVRESLAMARPGAPPAVQRLLRAAFELARARPRRRLCAGDSADVLARGPGPWSHRFRAVAADYPEVNARLLAADGLVVELVQSPQAFDVVVADRLLGGVLGALGAGMAGALELAPSADLHPGGPGLFEAAPGASHPLASVLAGALLFEHLGFAAAATELEGAVREVLAAGPAADRSAADWGRAVEAVLRAGEPAWDGAES